MKKISILVLSFILIFSFAACERNEQSIPAGSSDLEALEEESSTADEFRVGVIHVGAPETESGYSYVHDKGIIAMQNSLGMGDSQIIRRNNIADAAAARAAVEECIEEGCKIIFGTSPVYADVMAELAGEHSDVVFSVAAGNISNGSNLNSYFGRIYQAQYLAGIAAGLKTESGLIGYVAAEGRENSAVTSGIDAFAMGVERVNPDANIYVKVTDSWDNSELERQGAEELISMGCDVIAQHCDSAEPQLAAEEGEVWGCGYNSNMTADAPAAHLTAPMWNWGVYYTMAVKAVMEGRWTGDSYFGGMDEGMVELSALSKNCAEGTSDEIAAATAEIFGGKDVFSGEIIDNEGNVICAEDGALDDETIIDGIHWYYRNVGVI